MDKRPIPSREEWRAAMDAFAGSIVPGGGRPVGKGSDGDVLDVAIVGAGVAGTYLADRLAGARPDWTIRVFERSNRIGGRLWSAQVGDVAQPIELGGMRYLPSHPLIHRVITEHGIATRAFDPLGGPERSFLRGRFGRGHPDPKASAGYDLPAIERGRSADDLIASAFERIVPGAHAMGGDDWGQMRATAAYLGRPITDWALDDALATVLSPEGLQFIQDSFGYDTGFNVQNAGDEVEFILGGNDPGMDAPRVPIDGMDSIPRALAARFERRGGQVELGREVRRVAVTDGVPTLELGDGNMIRATHIALAIPIAALTSLVAGSPLLVGAPWRRLFDSVTGVEATKLYCWYDRPWWRDGPDAQLGVRTTTDLSNRMLYYVDGAPDKPAALLASFTDFRRARRTIELAGGVSNGEPAPAPLLDEVTRNLRSIHPYATIPEPAGSAFMHWGSSPGENAWSFWRPGHNSDQVMALALHPDPTLPIYLCGETFSRAQAWAEGALATAEALACRLLEGPALIA
jgi:monoamine oxidase